MFDEMTEKYVIWNVLEGYGITLICYDKESNYIGLYHYVVTELHVNGFQSRTIKANLQHDERESAWQNYGHGHL